jgi:hypothetical protein
MIRSRFMSDNVLTADDGLGVQLTAEILTGWDVRCGRDKINDRGAVPSASMYPREIWR